MTNPASVLHNVTVAAVLSLGLMSVDPSAAFAQPSSTQPAKPAPGTAQPAPTTKPTTTPEKPTEKPAEKPTAKPAETPAAPTTPANPSAPVNPADQIMKDLEQSARNREGTNASGSKVPKAEPGVEIPTAKLLREGTFVTSKRGRMTRGGSGDWQINFDADAEGRIDPPMGLMPCMNLQAMEKLVEKGGDSVTFTISGQVFLYKGRNYLLPTMYIVNRKGDLSPAG
ncbi:MAG: hypothetical protein IBJ18_03415 [Phycisphaerales bacterium]|nr:hypothetical protein [Phycisphaerales bacterium]